MISSVIIIATMLLFFNVSNLTYDQLRLASLVFSVSFSLLQYLVLAYMAGSQRPRQRISGEGRAVPKNILG